MSYPVSCQCGMRHLVSATEAGSRIRCPCGNSLDVPTLSSLRSSAGETPYPASTIEKIKAMIRDGRLPSGEICPYSGRPVNDTVFFHVQCERSSIEGESNTVASIIFGLIAGIRGARILAEQIRPPREVGRNTLIEIPLRISSDVRKQVLRIRRQKTLKALLCHTPIYAQLLQEYPDASVKPIKPD
jgi:hypothetical protein